MEVISKLHEKCEKCQHLNDCDEKRMVACKLAELPNPLGENMQQVMTMPIAEEMLVKHDYRTIKVSPTQSATIDMEKLAENIERSLYKSISCQQFRFGG